MNQEELEPLALETCQKFLSLQDLKEICRHRGFSVPSGKKEDVCAFVSARLLDTAGLAQAAASLDEQGVLLLHAINMKEGRAGIGDLRPIIQPGVSSQRWLDDRSIFQRCTNLLLNHGLLLIRDDQRAWHQESRFSRAEFILPELFRSHLPALSIRTEEAGDTMEQGSLEQLLKDSLRLAAMHALGLEQQKKTDAGLVDAVAGKWSFRNVDNKLRFAGKDHSLNLAETVRSAWVERWARKMTDGRAPVDRIQWVSYAISRVAPGHGVSIPALQEFLRKLSAELSAEQLSDFLNEGVSVGLLLTHKGVGQQPVFSADPAQLLKSEHSSACTRTGKLEQAAAEQARLSFDPHEQGVSVNFDRVHVASLLFLAQFALVAGLKKVEKQDWYPMLVLSPDALEMGRHRWRWHEHPVFAAVRKISPPFDSAAAQVEERHGKLLLHKGMDVLRITDNALFELLVQQFGTRAKKLSSQYLAVPNSLSRQAQDMIRKHGFVIRRVS